MDRLIAHLYLVFFAVVALAAVATGDAKEAFVGLALVLGVLGAVAASAVLVVE